MKTKLFFAVASVVLVLHGTAWAQYGPGYAPPMAYPPAAYAPGAPAAYGPGPMMMGPGQPMPMPCPEAQGAPCDSGDCFPPLMSVYGWNAFGDFLYMRPRNAQVPLAVAVPPGSPPPSLLTPIQSTPVASAELDYQPAWRVGIGKTLDACSRISATYTRFDGDSNVALTAPDGLQLRSLVQHPTTWDPGSVSDFLDAFATYEIEFDLGDVDYRYTFLSSSRGSLTFLAGVRYANLRETFLGSFTNVAIEEVVSTSTHFEGAGPRVGLEAERRNCDLGLFVYGHSTANFIAGNAHSSYVQQDNLRGVTVLTGFNSQRIVTILDLEVGVGWSSPGERIRVAVGYQVSGWFNMLKTDDLVRAVQQNEFVGLGSTMTFDGAVARAEVRF
jgi:hypothetical protein